VTPDDPTLLPGTLPNSVPTAVIIGFPDRHAAAERDRYRELKDLCSRGSKSAAADAARDIEHGHLTLEEAQAGATWWAWSEYDSSYLYWLRRCLRDLRAGAVLAPPRIELVTGAGSGTMIPAHMLAIGLNVKRNGEWQELTNIVIQPTRDGDRLRLTVVSHTGRQEQYHVRPDALIDARSL
jgi:hypothetical protein